MVTTRALQKRDAQNQVVLTCPERRSQDGTLLFSWPGCKSHTDGVLSEPQRWFSRQMGPSDVPYILGSHIEKGQGLLISLVCLGMQSNARAWAEAKATAEQEEQEEGMTLRASSVELLTEQEIAPGDVHLLNTLARLMSNDREHMVKPEAYPHSMRRSPHSDTLMSAIAEPATAAAWTSVCRLAQVSPRCVQGTINVEAVIKLQSFREELAKASLQQPSLLKMLEEFGVSDKLAAEVGATAHRTIAHPWASEFYRAAAVLTRANTLWSEHSWVNGPSAWMDELVRIAFDCVVATSGDPHRRSLCANALFFLCASFEASKAYLNLSCSTNEDTVSTIVKLVLHSDEAVVIPAVRLLGSYTSATDDPLDLLVKCGYLRVLPKVLGRCRDPIIPKDGLWALSNTLAGTFSQSKAAMEEGCVAAALPFLVHENSGVRFETMEALLTVFDPTFPHAIPASLLLAVSMALQDYVYHVLDWTAADHGAKGMSTALSFVNLLNLFVDKFGMTQDRHQAEGAATQRERSEVTQILTRSVVLEKLRTFSRNFLLSSICPQILLLRARFFDCFQVRLLSDKDHENSDEGEDGEEEEEEEWGEEEEEEDQSEEN